MAFISLFVTYRVLNKTMGTALGTVVQTTWILALTVLLTGHVTPLQLVQPKILTLKKEITISTLLPVSKMFEVSSRIPVA